MILHTTLIVLWTFFFQTDSIEGTWITTDDETGNQKSEVLIFKENGKLYGKITKLLLPEDQGKKCINCKGKNKDRYGRLIAICYANEINLNSTMVKEGWAIAYRYYSDDYINEEESAKKNNRGIWEGAFLEPYIWRKNN